MDKDPSNFEQPNELSDMSDFLIAGIDTADHVNPNSNPNLGPNQSPNSYLDPDIEPRDSELTERLMFLRDHMHLVPHSSRELNHMFYLSSDQYTTGGAAKYLAIIYQHNHPEVTDIATEKDPDIGVYMKLIDEFSEYAWNARVNISMLQQISDVISEQAKDDEPLSSQGLVREWKHDDGSLKRVIGEITRHRDSVLFLDGDGPKNINIRYGFNDQEATAREELMIQELSVGEVRRTIKRAIEFEKNRLAFWVEQFEGREADPAKGVKKRTGLLSIMVAAVKARVQQIIDKLKG